MSTSRTKEEISRYHTGYPEVNIKVYASITDRDVKNVGADTGYALTLEWVEEQLEDDDAWFWEACEFEFEYLADWVREIFADDGLRIYREGRQGGWMVVEGLPDVDDWDARMLGKWRKVERVARDIADGIPYQVVSLLAMNVWEPLQADKREDVDNALSEGVRVAS